MKKRPNNYPFVLITLLACTFQVSCTTDEENYFTDTFPSFGTNELISTDNVAYQMNVGLQIYYFKDGEEHPYRTDYWNPGTILANTNRFDFYNFPTDEVVQYLPNMRYYAMSTNSIDSNSTSLSMFGFDYTREELSAGNTNSFVGSADSIGWHIPAHRWSFLVADDSNVHTVDVCFNDADNYIVYSPKEVWTYRTTMQADSILLDGERIPDVTPQRPYLIHLEAQVDHQYN